MYKSYTKRKVTLTLNKGTIVILTTSISYRFHSKVILVVLTFTGPVLGRIRSYYLYPTIDDFSFYFTLVYFTSV